MADTSKSTSSEIEELRNQLDELRAADPAPMLAAAKQRVGETVSTVAANVTDTVATPIRQSVDRVRGAVAGACRTAAQVDAQVNAQKESLSQRIRGQPFLAVGVAGLTGYVFGRIMR